MRSKILSLAILLSMLGGCHACNSKQKLLNAIHVRRLQLRPTPTPLPTVTIEEISIGKGMAAVFGTTLTVRAVGSFVDGRKIESSQVAAGRSLRFKVGSGKVLPGLEKGVVGMKVGGKRKVTVPPVLGYGAHGAGDAVPPNSTLIYEVELLKVE